MTLRTFFIIIKTSNLRMFDISVLKHQAQDGLRFSGCFNLCKVLEDGRDDITKVALYLNAFQLDFNHRYPMKFL